MEQLLIKCQNCGVEFTPKPYRKPRHCSQRCVGLASMRKRWTRTPDQRYWDKVDRRGPNECWPWTAGRTKDGYGRMHWDGKNAQPATHVGWALHHGSAPDGHVLHKCDHPWCHNPAHWFTGTNADNNKDRHQKGRYSHCHKESPLQKLDWDRVNQIRVLYAGGEFTQRQLARQFGVSQAKIHHIISFKNWKPDGMTERPKIIRKVDRHGEKASKAKLTNDQARAIRAQWDAGGISRMDLARQYGVDYQVISGVVRGRYYPEPL